MHLVDEQHGFLATRHQPFVSAREHITHVFDTGGHGGQFFKHTTGLSGNDGGERGLAHAGRPE